MSVSQQKLAAAKAWLKTAAQKTKAVVLNKTEVELLVERATNDEPWGPHGKILADLAQISHDGEKFASEVWPTLRKRLTAPPSDKWRQSYKAQLVMQHLVVNSSQFVVQAILDNGAPLLEALLKYNYLDDKGKDQGINVRNRAKEMLWLLESPDRIRDARAKAKAAKAKYGGIEGGTAALPVAGSSTSSASASVGSSPAAPSLVPRGSEGAAPEETEGLGTGGGAAVARALSPAPTAAHDADSVAATAARIRSLKQVKEEAPISFEAFPGEGPSAAGNAGVERSSRSASALPSLRDLTEAAARRGGPKKLSETRVHAAIASSLGGLRLGSSSPAAAAPAAHAVRPPVAAPATASEPAPVAVASTPGSPPAYNAVVGAGAGAAGPSPPASPPAFRGASLPASPPATAADAFDVFPELSSPVTAAPAVLAPPTAEALEAADDPFSALARPAPVRASSVPAPAEPASPTAVKKLAGAGGSAAAVFSLNVYATAAAAGTSSLRPAPLPDMFASGGQQANPFLAKAPSLPFGSDSSPRSPGHCQPCEVDGTGEDHNFAEVSPLQRRGW